MAKEIPAPDTANKTFAAVLCDLQVFVNFYLPLPALALILWSCRGGEEFPFSKAPLMNLPAQGLSPGDIHGGGLRVDDGTVNPSGHFRRGSPGFYVVCDRLEFPVQGVTKAAAARHIVADQGELRKRDPSRRALGNVDFSPILTGNLIGTRGVIPGSYPIDKIRPGEKDRPQTAASHRVATEKAKASLR